MKENTNINRNYFETKNNPFAKGCKDCIKNIWDKINKRAEELNAQCYPNTYIWIEKFKDDTI